MSGVNRANGLTGNAPSHGETHHHVRSGETLSQIASHYGVSITDLMHANHQLTNPDRIFAGQTLTIPRHDGRRNSVEANNDAHTYTVKPGDTLSAVAARQGIDMARLLRANVELRHHPNSIHPGDRVNLPGNQRTASTNTPPRTPRTNGTAPRPTTVQPRTAPQQPPTTRHTPPLNTPTNTQSPQANAPATTPGTRTNAPNAAPNAPAINNGYANVDLNDFLSVDKGTNSLAAIVIGNAEGTRRPDGKPRDAYQGHTDPGDGRGNKGSFSYAPRGAHDPVARTPEEADRIQLGHMRGKMNEYETKMKAAGLDPNSALLASAYFDALNQSPRAAAKMLDQADYMRQNGVTVETVRQWRFRGYVNVQTGSRWEYPGRNGKTVRAGGGLAKGAQTETEKQAGIRQDQNRRIDAMVVAMREQGLTRTNNANAPQRTAPPTTSAPRPAADTTVNRSSSRTTSVGGAHYTLKGASVRLSDNARQTLAQIASEYHRQTGKDLIVTDGNRTPHEQAVQVLKKINRHEADGLYKNKAALAEIKQAYTAGRAAGKSESEIVNNMARVIQSQVDRNVYISRHLRGGAADVRRNGAGGMTESDRQVFTKVVRDITGKNPLDEGDHYHLQF